MKRAVFASLILHAFVLLLFAVGIGDPFQTTLKNQQPLLIDFVQIAETSAAPQLSPSQKLEAAKPKPESVPPEPEKIPEPSQPEATMAETHPPVKAEKTSTPEEKKSPQHQESLPISILISTVISLAPLIPAGTTQHLRICWRKTSISEAVTTGPTV